VRLTLSAELGVLTPQTNLIDLFTQQNKSMNLISCAGPPMAGKKRSVIHPKTFLIMRLIILLTLLSCLNVTAKVYAQQISINVKDAPIEKVLDEIKKQSGYSLITEDHLLDKVRNVTLTLKNVSVQKALEQCFKGQPVVYEIIGKTILLKTKSPEHSYVPVGKQSVDTTITGKVTDTTGHPLQGAIVKIKGTNQATSVQADGSYQLKRVPVDAVLIFSMIGFQNQEFEVSSLGGNNLNVLLKVVISSLTEVSVVSTGYQQIPKERATGSYDLVSNKLLNRSVSTDIISRLRGIASGLNFDNSAGNSVGISIRGRSTLLSNTQPLIVLDNFPYEGDLNNINPNDIESVTILKDAAAASIWGALAGNGVIVITTKKSKFNQPLSIDFISNLTLQKKPNLFYSGNQFLNPTDYIAVEKTLFNNGFYDGQLNDQVNYPAVSPAVEILDNLKNGIITSSQASEQLLSFSNHDVRNDLSKYFYRSATLQQYSLSIRGGNSNTNYVFSVGEDNNLKNEVGNKYNRLTLNSNVTFRPTSNLELYANVNFVNSNTTTNSNASTLTSPGFLYPYARLADDKENPLPINKYYSNSFIASAPGTGLLDWSYSPLDELRNTDNTSKLSNIRINTGLNYKIIGGLSAEVRYQYEKVINTGRNFASQNSYAVRSLVNQFSIIDNGQVSFRNIPLGGILDLSNNDIVTNYVRGQLNYNKKWGNNELNVIAGAEARELEGNGNNSRLYGYDNETGTSQPVNYIDYLTVYPGGGSSTIQNNTAISQTTDRYRSVFGNASYNYNYRYILSASARFDQSNLFGVNTNQKGVPLWSAGLKWNLDNETFYKFDWMPKLSLRATYGSSGNVNKSISSFTIAQYLSNNLVPATNYAYIVYPGNPDLKWEKVAMLNLGLDFEFKEILSGSFEYYKKYGSDLIGNSPLALSTGFGAATGNFADLTGKGFDLSLTSRNIHQKSFIWSTTLFASYAIDKVTKYLGGNTLSTYYGNIEVGAPFNSIFLNKFEGLDNNGNPQGLLNGQLSTNYNSLNNLPNSDKKSYRTQPGYFGSFRNDFTFKQLSLSFNIIFKAGYYFLRRGVNYNALYNYGIGNPDFVNRWQTEGDELHTTVPSMLYPNNPDRDAFYNNSTALVSNASNIRLQDISLSYVINKNDWRSMPFKSIQAMLYLNNLGILWSADKHGIDPDYQSGLVMPASISLGLKFGLN
jgi:TonB-linked SusC/RagA family outer membrane protein